MGLNDNPKDYSVTKDIAKRRVYPDDVCQKVERYLDNLRDRDGDE